MKLKTILFLTGCLAGPTLFPVSATNSFTFNNNNTGFKDNHRQTAAAFLTATDAFGFSEIQQGQQLNLFWQIAEGYYLYKDKIQISINDQPYTIVDMPNGNDYHDQYFGQVKIIAQQLMLSVPLAKVTPASTVRIKYQGCAAAGLCYPPITTTVITK